ncbi:hypothetical protein [Nisaea nitritireducens]|uniref:hypothetical protein n=1 Tax=Nisaea nitritireducens TaxID=568392 RepID=UPI001865F038|nr:hypothetical protein [Nisaea nitritireducens]
MVGARAAGPTSEDAPLAAFESLGWGNAGNRPEIIVPFAVSNFDAAVGSDTSVKYTGPVNQAIGEVNKALQYSVAFGARRVGVISIDSFLAESAAAHMAGASFDFFPVAACRHMTLTLSYQPSAGRPAVNIGQVNLTVPDVGHVDPIPFQAGTTLQLDPKCGIRRIE